MKAIWIAAIAAAVSISMQGGSRCTDPSLIFTISNSYTDPKSGSSYNSGLLNDGNVTYSNGVNGVNATLQICNGSNGATLGGLGVGRNVSLYLANTVAGTGLPSWASNPAPVLYLTIPFGSFVTNTTQDYYFTTYLKVTMAAPNTDYYFDMENSHATAPFNPPPSDLNMPCDTALVNVHHIPAASASNETWMVWPGSGSTSSCSPPAALVGTLLGPSPHSKSQVNVGQSTVPFYITIQRQ